MISLVNVFLEHDLDMLIAVRTPPYNSWKNPVERVNCILNLGLQSVGLMRCVMDAANEKRLKPCNSMKAIRSLAESHSEFKEAFADSISPVKALLSGVFQRLKLKDDPIQVFVPASDADIDNIWKNILSVDATITKNDTSKKVLMGKECLKRFFDHCCSVSYYAFGVKKCGQASCNICKPVRLPSDIFKTLHFLPQPQAKGDHYVSFDELYGVPTTEKDRPSLKNVQCKGAHGIPFSPNNQTARNVSECVMCGECLRPRVLHSKHKISFKDQKVLLQTLEDILFSCGASFKEVSPSIQPEDRSEAASSIFNCVFVRENLSCEMPVEVTYFSSESFVDICVHCACINSTQAALTLLIRFVQFVWKMAKIRSSNERGQCSKDPHLQARRGVCKPCFISFVYGHVYFFSVIMFKKIGLIKWVWQWAGYQISKST